MSDNLGIGCLGVAGCFIVSKDKDDLTALLADRYREIYAVVRKIPRGKVVTYGQLAELAGRPGAARMAGAAMRAVPEDLGLPWHRVVGKRSGATGRVSILDPLGGAVQRQLLEEEGVMVGDENRIDLVKHGWLPS